MGVRVPPPALFFLPPIKFLEMNISQEKVDALNALLKVEIKEADYADKVKSALKAQQKRASLPGFRPGKVPFGLIQKQFGVSVKVDEINKLVSNSINEYLTKEELNLLGQPLPVESGDFDWQNDKDFTLTYEMGLSPEIEVKLSEKDKFTYYNVVPDEQLIDNYVEELAMRYGKVSNPDVVGEKDMVAIDIMELDGEEVKENGFAGMVTVAVDRITNEAAKDQLIGKKAGEKVQLNIKELGADLAESAAILNKKVEDIEAAGDSFEVEVGTISRMEPAEIDQELFDKVYGPGTVTDVDGFRQKVKEETLSMMGDQGKGKFKGELIDYLLEKLNFEIPDAFMKKWLVLSSNGKLTEDALEKDYDQYQKSIKWQVIENNLITKNDIKVEFEEVQEKAKEMIANNFKQYGQVVPEDQLATYAANVLQKEDERRRLYDELYYDKIITLVKEKCKVEEKEIGYEAFVEMMNKEHQHDHDHDHAHDHAHAH